MKRYGGQQLRPGDFIIGAFFLLTTVGLLLFLLFGRSTVPGTRVRIPSDGQEIGCYTLDEERKLTITLGQYENTVCITAGTVSVVAANCPDQYCVHHKPICRSGETIVCLPARLVLTVIGSEEATLDGISR